MKLWEKRHSKEWKNVVYRRTIRGLRARKKKKLVISTGESDTKIVTIDAPKTLDLYRKNNYEKTVLFISELSNQIKTYGCLAQETKKIIHVNFQRCEQVTAAAVILMISSVESAINNISCEKPKFRITRPHPVKFNHGRDKVGIVDSVLNRLGFYAALGFKKYKARELPNVKCWDVIRGVKVESETAGRMLQEVECSLEKQTAGKAKRLYSPLIEAMNNAVEHAYNESIWDGKLPKGSRWWCFTALIAGELTMLIADKGLGIPSTLEKTQTDEVLQKLKEAFGGLFKDDADYIKAAMDVKRTRTNLSHRGNGGKDLKSAIQDIKGSRLTVFSNKGLYRYRHKVDKNNSSKLVDVKENYSGSINGTIVEITIPLPKGI